MINSIMADANVLKPFILSYEGGYVENKYDGGGATMKGVTLSTFQSVYGNDKDRFDLKRITDDQWLHIFDKYYWNKCKGDSIESQPVANMLVDWYWHSGNIAIKKMQRLIGCADDGIMGPKTLKAINDYDSRKLFDLYKRQRVIYLERIAHINPTQKVFLKGWLRRVEGIQYDCLILSNGKRIDV